MDHLDPRAKDHPEDGREENHRVDPHTEGHPTGVPLEDRLVDTASTNCRKPASPRTFGDGSCISSGESGIWRVR